MKGRAAAAADDDVEDMDEDVEENEEEEAEEEDEYIVEAIKDHKFEGKVSCEVTHRSRALPRCEQYIPPPTHPPTHLAAYPLRGFLFSVMPPGLPG